MAKVFSEYEGTKEFRSRDLDHLLRQLTVDLEFSFGETVSRGEPEPPPNLDEEGGFIDEDRF